MSQAKNEFNVRQDFIRTANIMFDIVDGIIKFFLGRTLATKLQFDLSRDGIDQRIAKLTVAREAIVETLAAIDELRMEADENRAAAAKAVAELQNVQLKKDAEEQRLIALKEIVQVDVSMFRVVAGIPTEKQLFHSKITGFITGIIASLIAAGLWQIGEWILRNWIFK